MTLVRTLARIALGVALTFAGISHLTFARSTFLAQVPPLFAAQGDLVVMTSGLVEIALGIALIFTFPAKRLVGVITALFFLAVFPGNISQFVGRIDAFGLDTDLARGIRLLFQPMLVIWALWSTAANGERWYTLNLKRPR